jgi:hypothetical protein
MIVKEQKKIQFINDCGCLVDEPELAKAIQWYSDKPVARLKHIYIHGAYPAISIYKEKLHIHRLLMMYWENRVLNPTEYVHHCDGNKLNALKDNLSIIEQGRHQSLHNSGKSLSLSHRQKLSEANRKRKGVPHKKRRHIPKIQMYALLASGMSINGIAKYYGVDWSTIKSRIYDNPELLEQSSC